MSVEMTLSYVGSMAFLAMSASHCFAQAPATQVMLNVLCEVLNDGSDYMTTTNPTELSEFPIEGQVYYIPSYNGPGQIPLYRLLYPALPDHMDSTLAGEGGYTTEGPLGYPYTSQTVFSGLSSVERWLKSGGSDHATSDAAIGGYRLDANLPVYGYGRYGNAQYSIFYSQGGGVSVGSDIIAGGAIASWMWNSAEFIDSSSYGRYLQSDFFYTDPSNDKVSYNPDEAGDGTGSVGPLAHGSPLIGTNITASSQLTLSAPLDYFPSSFGGGTTQAVIYPTLAIGKNLILNYRNLGPVAQYTSEFWTPNALKYVIAETPTGYLRSQFSVMYTFDAGTATLTNVTAAANGCTGAGLHWSPPSGYGGIIVTDTTGSFGMGVYGVLVSNGGSVGDFNLWANLACVQTNKWNITYGGPFVQGENAFNSYIISQNLQNIEAYMSQLYALGVK